MKFLQRPLFASRWHLVPIVICLYWLWPERFLNTPSIGLDWSWTLSLSEAYHQKLIFGKDWVFTYGPLGWLSTRADHFANKPALFAFDLVKMALWVNVIQFLIEKCKPYKYGVFLAMYAVLMLSLLPDLTLELLFMFQFFLFRYHTERKFAYLLISLSIGILMFFIKLNYAFIGSLILLFYLLLNAVHQGGKANVLKSLGLFGAYLLALIVLSQVFYVDLLSYIRNSLHIISGYNDGMNIYNSYQLGSRKRAYLSLLVAFPFAWTVWFGGIFFFRAFKDYWFDCFLWVCASVSFYLIFKHAFTYYSTGPSSEFFTSAPAWISFIFLFCRDSRLRLFSIRCVVLFLIVGPVGLASSWLANPVGFPYADLVLQSKGERESLKEDRKRHYIEKSQIRNIAGGSVDVFPTHLDIAIYNDLKYKPRPVILGYKAYTPALQELNYAYLLSEKAPDYILYELSLLDHFHLDARSRRAMLQAYKVKKEVTTRAGDTLLVLQKQDKIAPIREEVVVAGEARLNEWCRVPADSLSKYWLISRVDYDFWGHVRRFFFQPPRIYLEVEYADRSIERRSAVPPCFPSGFPLQRVNSREEHYEWFSNGGLKNQSVIAFRYVSDQAGFNQTIPYSVLTQDLLSSQKAPFAGQTDN